MALSDKYLLIISMDVDADTEELFNEVYDTEHIPAILKVPGVISVTRAKAEPFSIGIGGGVQDMPIGDNPIYTNIVELESPDVLLSKEWGEAVQIGRWPTDVRPHTSNRNFSLRKVIG